jgi:hypothetical protein
MLILDKGPNLVRASNIKFDDAAGFTPSGDFTIEIFGLKFTTTASNQTLYSHYTATGNQRSLLWDWISGGTGLRITLSTNGSSSTSISSAWTPTTGVEYNVAVERSGSTIRHYVNGAVQGSTGTFAGALFNTTDAAYIGSLTAFATPFLGTAKAFRFTVGVARYAGAYTPPSLPLPTS